MLEQIRGPADLQHLSQQQLRDLAAEIREFLIHKVAATGGHLGPNLGVVELTLALHRVFDSPHDPIIFDTGHQAYVHKMLTGRCHDFESLRKKGGLSGYPSRAESEHDWVESSHASAALSYADGLAKAFELSGHRNRHVVAVVGDGALTGGMCWEALNNIAASRPPGDHRRQRQRPQLRARRSAVSPTIWPRCGCSRRTSRRWRGAATRCARCRWSARLAYRVMHSVKAGIKDSLSPQLLFTDLGLKYVGPVDGHDERAVEVALRQARGFGRPVIVHVVTRKGMGYRAGRGRRGRTDAFLRRDRPGHRPGHQGRRPGLDGDLLRRADRLRQEAPRRRRHHRGDARPHRADGVRAAVPGPLVRRRHRRAARDDVGGRPGDGRACTRWWPSIRPSSTGPSTRS